MSWQQKLESYKTNQESARQEVLRAKQVYQNEATNWKGQGQFNQSARAKQITNWANQVRQVASLSNDMYGSGTSLAQAQNNFSKQPSSTQPQTPKYGVQIQPKKESSAVQPTERKQSTFNPQNAVDPNEFKTELTSIEDFMKKYGINYSRDYAKQIAEQSLNERLANIETTRRQSEQDFEKGAQGIDMDFFKQYQALQQEQVERGLNGGLAAGQDTQMALGRQMALGDLYNSRANANYELNQKEGLARSEAVLNEEKMYQERLQQAFQNTLAEGQFNQAEQAKKLQAALQMAQMQQEQDQFNINTDMKYDQMDFDKAKWSDQYGLEQDKFQSDQERFNAEMQLQGDKFNFDKESEKFDREMKTKEFDFMTEKEKTRVKEWQKEFGLESDRLAEMVRHNKEGEKINWAQLNEQIRSNKASESIAKTRANSESQSKMTNSDMATIINEFGKGNVSYDDVARTAAALEKDGRITDKQHTDLIKQMNRLRWNNGGKEEWEQTKRARENQKKWSDFLKGSNNNTTGYSPSGSLGLNLGDYYNR